MKTTIRKVLLGAIVVLTLVVIDMLLEKVIGTHSILFWVLGFLGKAAVLAIGYQQLERIKG